MSNRSAILEIDEVSEIVEVAPSVLRYWESEFPSLARGYDQRGVLRALQIRELLDEDGLTIAEARETLGESPPSKPLDAATRADLMILRHKLTELLDLLFLDDEDREESEVQVTVREVVPSSRRR